MGDEVTTAEEASAIARSYAEEEGVGTVGDVESVTRKDDVWIVELLTHTFAHAYSHEITITVPVGNVISHERTETPA